jgi:hypothetical protein
VRYHWSGHSPIADIVAQALCAGKSRGDARVGQARDIAAVRALDADDTPKHRLLIGVSDSVGVYARGLQRAMEDAT